MQIKVDNTTDMTGCHVITVGQTLFITTARGSDSYMYAARIVNNENSAYSTAGSYSSTVSYKGKVSSSTTLNTLYLITEGGTVQIKLDSSTTISGKPLMEGETVTVNCGLGTDETWHAMSITY